MLETAEALNSIARIRANDSRQIWSPFARPPYFPARSPRRLARSQNRKFSKALVLYYLAHAQAD
jgi:hypothetical protein